MVHTCVVRGCKSQWSPGSAIKFHVFPKDTQRRNDWLALVPLKTAFYNNAKICSLHFKWDDYDHSGRKLKQMAKPFFNENIEEVMETEECIPSVLTVQALPYTINDPLPYDEKLIPLCDDIVSPMIEPAMPSTSSANILLPIQCQEYEQHCFPLGDIMELKNKRPLLKRHLETSLNQRDANQDIENIPRMEQLPSKKANRRIQVNIKSNREKILQRKYKILMQQVKRQTKYMNNMKSLLATVKRYTSTSEIENIIKGNFADICKKFKDVKLHSNAIRYSDEVKAFALTLHFYSPKAYEFLKKHVSLPHVVTLRRSLATFNCNVGFLQEVLEFLKVQVQIEGKSYLKNVALIFDGMALKEDLAYDKKLDKVFGYVDLGQISVSDPEEPASEALVFQIVSYTDYFKCPIAYFFIKNSLSGELLAELLTTAITMLDEIGITVRSLTCDGARSNLKAYENLGCSLDPENFRPYFPHPNGRNFIYCLLDAAHMLKLARNVLADHVITDDSGNTSFEYIRKLHEVQKKEGLKFANKLNSLHVDYKNKKMNVKLAAQVLSSSVADALDFLRVIGNPDFKDSQTTVKFLRIIDRLFDLMNSKSPFGRNYKSPLSLKNKCYWDGIFTESEVYLKSLKIGDKNILNHPRKTFAIGFLMNITSFKLLVTDLCTQDNFNYLLTFKCSQDNIEIFFSCIRARGRSQNNPSPLEFHYIMRKLLFRNSIQPAVSANCIDHTFESSFIFDFNKKHSLIERETKHFENIFYDIDLIDTSAYQDNILYYITGYIVNQILARISCTYCHEFLTSDYSENDHTYMMNVNKYNSFTAFVNRGKLCFPSASAFKIVKYADKVFKRAVSMGHLSEPNIKNKLITTVLFHFSPMISQIFKHPVTSSITCDDLHETKILKEITNSFLMLRIRSYLKTQTDEKLGSIRSKRQKLLKTVIFNHI